MHIFRRFFLASVLSLSFIISLSMHTVHAMVDKENTLVIDLKHGQVHIQMFPALAPMHVKRVKRLAREKFYDGVVFHRVIAGFMAQTGDPTGTGTSGSKYPDLRAEFNKTPFKRGVVGAARTNMPDTANSQFFICLADARFLDGKYTVWGKVTKGMKFVDRIRKGEPSSGAVVNPDKMLKVRILADIK